MAAGTLFTAYLIAVSSLGQNLSQTVIDEQNANFQRSWNTDLVWKFDDLPTEGTVPEYRVPYSGHIYLDRQGGTVNALRKYDQAFHGTSFKASRHEQWDTTAFRKTYYQTVRMGLFGSRQVAVTATPHWHGHCNGWSAASIRHAEPQQSVVRNGVTFTPSDIKGLLAEIYIYQDTLNVGGEYGVVHPAELHVALANWIGRFSHPIAMEADPGKEKWNYPLYGYACSFSKRGNRVEVKTNVRYAQFSEGELDQSPRLAKTRYFHYELRLNDDGQIIGGYYYRDSSRLDLLWVPLRPVDGGLDGNERGNPYVKVDEVLSIWRESVPEDLITKWVMIQDPPAQREIEPDSEIVVAVADGENGMETATDAADEEPVDTTPAAADEPAAPATTEAAGE